MNLGIQRELHSGLVLSADFIRNVGLHYLLTHDTNHVGDARFLNKAAALNAISLTNAAFGCGGTTSAAIDCAINAGATISDYAGNGLDSGQTALSAFPITAFGGTPDTGVAFPGMNPLVGENSMLFSGGRSVYTALQLKVVHNVANPMRGLKHVSWQASYALSRFNSMSADQDFISLAFDQSNPGHYFGPGSLDRTHQVSFGGTFDILHGPRLSLVSHFFSPLANNLAVTNQARAGEIFFTDFIGDGSPAPHVLPGQQLGSWGRSVTASNINDVVSQYNANVAGTLLPAANALVSANLFTADQLKRLRAVADVLQAAPADQMNMTWLHGFDAKLSWPIKVKERVSIEPSVGFYNLFNFANFNAPGNTIGGGNGEIASCAFNTSCPISSAVSATGLSVHDAATRDSIRIGAGTGANTIGSPRQLDFGLKLTF
jgi:hypothetical protein